MESSLKPVYLMPVPEGIPGELRARLQWVNWRPVLKDGKWTKEPISPHTGGLAKSNDPATWATFDVALTADPRHLGFVFTGHDPHFGVDLDKCRDADSGTIEPWALDIMGRLPDLYWEASASGTGVHGIGRGTLPPGRRKRGKVEMYDRGRYFTMTGHALPGGSR